MVRTGRAGSAIVRACPRTIRLAGTASVAPGRARAGKRSSRSSTDSRATRGSWSHFPAGRGPRPGHSAEVTTSSSFAWVPTRRGSRPIALPWHSPALTFRCPPPCRAQSATLPIGRAYAISERHHGVFLEDVPPERAEALGSTLADLLLALYAARARGRLPVLWHQHDRSALLLAPVLDVRKTHRRPRQGGARLERVAGRRPRLAARSSGAAERMRALLDAVPERRDLVHGDLLHGNVRVRPDATPGRGGVLMEVLGARRLPLRRRTAGTFWAPWHEGIAAADVLPRGARRTIGQGRAESPSSTPRGSPSPVRLHIGFTHLGWNLWTGNHLDLDATAQRLDEVLERGPLPLTGD